MDTPPAFAFQVLGLLVHMHCTWLSDIVLKRNLATCIKYFLKVYYLVYKFNLQDLSECKTQQGVQFYL